MMANDHKPTEQVIDLAEEKRQIIFLFFVEQMSIQKIADRRGLTMKCVERVIDDAQRSNRIISSRWKNEII